jgi:N-acetyl-anhydromuramyl-L-alanine amidase AmpD
MAAYLVDHPPVRSQYRRPRRERPSGVVAENTPDYVAFDGGAEAVARFIQSRTTPGSYHDLADSDSCIQLVPYEWEAFHDGTGTNSHSYGLSFATRADTWPMAPQAWRDGAIEQGAQAAARYARWVKSAHGVTVPATRITADEARNRRPGFVTHAQLDPGRRSDPGRDFPWGQFLARYATLTGSPEPDTANRGRQLVILS